jgi:UDP-N-acetylmuramyl pentapeptide phosphotransferase/UDP-N-acetylglucosamine-1-phosphate transferase
MMILFAFVSALSLSYLGTRFLLDRKPARGFVDIPNERSSHDRPKPRFGGVAIVGAFFATFAWGCVVFPQLRSFAPMAVGSAILFAAGLLDDWRGLGVGARLAVQFIAAGAALAAGNVLDHVTLPVVGEIGLGWFAYPLSLLFIVASINFYNFVDGIDGLAAGGAFIAASTWALIASMLGQPAIALVCVIAAGAALGFLQFNFPPSKLFMGDSGSTFFGYCFAYLAIAGSTATPAIPIFVPMLLLSSLYLDAGLTILRRLTRGERVFQPHRTHYYQRLLQLGFNHKQVTLVEYLIMVLLGASAAMYVKAGNLFAPFMSAVWIVLFTLGILKIRALERGDRMFWERRAVLLIVTDLAAIVAAYLGAYFLRMNFEFTSREGMAVLRALPIVVVVRSACFFKYGLYRSMWRYTSVSDVVRVIKAVTAGSAIVLAAVVLLYRFVAFPRTLFLIEYFLLIVLILGVRFSTRLFHEIGREPQGASARRYAVIGAGDAGERAAREINSMGPARMVVCFIDDDPARAGLLLHGVPVAGPAERLADACARYRVDALVYAVTDGDEATAARWLTEARRAGMAIERLPEAAEEREPAAMVLDRVARHGGRRINQPSARAQSTLRGARVLVTHGGERIGAGLVAALRSLGAIPIVHVDAGRAESAARDATLYAGPLLLTARDVIAGAKPDVVLHAVTVEALGAENEDQRAWHHVVHESDVLVREVWTQRPGCRVVVAALWGRVRPGDRAAAIAATMEAVVLNRAGAESASVVRLPRILTAALVSDTTSSTRPASPTRFDALESEAILVLLEIAAGGFRGIYTLAPSPELELDEARRALAALPGALDRRRGARGRSTSGSGLVFPSEHLDVCGVEGAQRILSPLFPASEPFRALAMRGPSDASRAERDEWTRAVTAQLYHLDAQVGRGAGPQEQS